mgnify:CR=1 FL=1
MSVCNKNYKHKVNVQLGNLIVEQKTFSSFFIKREALRFIFFYYYTSIMSAKTKGVA